MEHKHGQDVVSWTWMISGPAKCGFVEEAILKFMYMDVEPNYATLVIVMSACFSLGAFKFGKVVHGYCLRNLRGRNIILDNAGLVFYLRCGSLVSASVFFDWGTEFRPVDSSLCKYVADLMVNGNVGNALLNMYDKCGEVRMAISVFKGLDSSSHTGLVDQGLIVFSAMKDVYGIVPKTQHYACRVHMYGRAGFLEEAEGFFKEMPTKADGSVWGALLNACRIHGNDNMFERIRDGLLKSRGLSTGTYALSSNMYANQ
ncbi:PREDICTED: pentatricopeptide repeat-containing [Prunus dulcis]|uniref:PREDICTED: pentatricopeptide repeat-containing n=1 Tax=Prunus dulcis TaxID=3755 RepID=A0A5E4G371_PRUDU|nr:PREDICTED: pentatricopeptide repeat-containing [Prunus dulcis]